MNRRLSGGDKAGEDQGVTGEDGVLFQCQHCHSINYFKINVYMIVLLSPLPKLRSQECIALQSRN